MTPPEVVTYMCRIAADELSALASTKSDELLVADPSCGVGSFLAQSYTQFRRDARLANVKIMLIGQDKVDRMARLAKLNLLLFKTAAAHIYRGNSLIGDSPLDAYSSRCDLILTNPPFGARFPAKELRQHGTRRYPLLSDLIESSNGTIDSELLFLDRYYDLLKPSGILLAVLPDAVISAAGLPAVVRDRVGKSFIIRSITELPSVTFGQAGTRTKTCVLHLQKKPAPQTAVFMGTATRLGFEVSSRKGVPVKRVTGTNDLERLAALFNCFSQSNGRLRAKVLSEDPSCVAVPPEVLRSQAWTPNHHSAVRYKTLKALSGRDEDKDYEIVQLRDLVFPLARSTSGDQQLWDTLSTGKQTSLRVSETADDWSESKCISILHVGDFGFLNIRELLNYRPKYPGQACRAGDVLFSKINPRIPRVLVVPKLPVPLTCSTEFEVLRVKPDFSAFSLALLLLSTFAQNQILSLTSGTSSSHNRIKTAQLLDVRLPIPRPNTPAHTEFKRATQTFEKAQQRLQQSAYDSYESLVTTNHLLASMIK